MTAELKPAPCPSLLEAVAAYQYPTMHGATEDDCLACKLFDALQSAAMNTLAEIDALRAELAAARAELSNTVDALKRMSSEREHYRAELAAERARLEWCIGTMISKCGQFLWLDGVEGVHIGECETARDVIDRLIGEAGDAG